MKMILQLYSYIRIFLTIYRLWKKTRKLGSRLRCRVSLHFLSEVESTTYLLLKVFTQSIKEKRKKEYWEAGRDNGASIDYDHLGLFAYEDAPSDIYQKIADWLKETTKVFSSPTNP